ncbi:dihydrodipicolinate synthase family protein [Microbacterium limosum]|uniref:Dihydrodipicolinate synthase family protein n=1 Tax=Microbacterium limosum TaxID=3079935 RepID=A0AAU0MJA5_9MICO|nr:dihydrodipicolinate synthase family protein [Microbacterium sp. Y20]WOQ70062.1 dihydrodipicolinate synthase family protein [Microbacterium sp. Y20]
MSDLRLLEGDGTVSAVELGPGLTVSRPAEPPRSRTVYAAAHVVPVAWAENVPGHPAVVDWDHTLAFRHHIWSWGLGVADAMDTAQRNMGLGWSATAELIRRSAHEASTVGGRLVAGVNTDHLPNDAATLAEIIDAYAMQLEVVEDSGAEAVLMASRHLARAAESPADYERVYAAVLGRASRPVVLHWLGEPFDPILRGYFGPDVETAMQTVVRIIDDHRDTVSGIKMSLLDPRHEITLRRRLPSGVTMFTGDDDNYVSLIAGDDAGHSDALLGAFAAFPPAAALAVAALDRGDTEEYHRVLGPTQPLARQIFSAPTPFYKTGVAFLSWLNGHQPSFTMVGGLHAGRSLRHLSEIIRLANVADVLEQPELARERWHRMLELHGV